MSRRVSPVRRSAQEASYWIFGLHAVRSGRGLHPHLRGRQGRMRCDPCRKRDLPVGSGIVESACKRIVGNRFKRSGRRWSKAAANAVPTIRRCLENSRWPDFLDWRACRAAAA